MMESNWQKLKIGEVLEQNDRKRILEPTKTYSLLGVRLEGKGPFVREEKLGSQILTKKLRRVNTGEFIYSRLFAWKGAFGLVSSGFDGAFVSNEFPTFKIDKNQVYPRFLELYFKQKYVWREVEKYCTGTTKASRNRFKEKFFLNLEISLPPLEEQKRIVAKIEKLITKVNEARKLRGEAVKEREKMFERKQKQVFSSQKCSRIKIENLIKLSSGVNLTSSQMEKNGRFLVYGGGGINGRYNQFMFDEKKIGIGRVGARCGGVFITEPKSWITDNALFVKEYADTLDFYYLAKSLENLDLRSQANQAAQPVVSQKNIKKLLIPLPPLPKQHRIVAYLDSLQSKQDKLMNLQEETEKELEKLVPSILDRAFRGEL